MRGNSGIPWFVRARPRAALFGSVSLFALSSCAIGTDTAAPPTLSNDTGGSPSGGSGGSGVTAGSGGFVSAGGMTSTAGAFSTSGTGGSAFTAGSGGSSGGTGGSGGSSGGTGGSGGSSAGSGGKAGSGGSVSKGGSGGSGGSVAVDCDAQAGKALPITLVSTWGYPDSGDDSYAEAPVGGNATCPDESPGGTAGGCWSIAWTPVTRTFVHWYWHNVAANWTGPGVCVEDGAVSVTLQARAATDGVEVSFIAAGVTQVATLTTAWQEVSINISNADYNGTTGVFTGLIVVIARDAGDTTPRTIYFDDVTWE